MSDKKVMDRRNARSGAPGTALPPPEATPEKKTETSNVPASRTAQPLRSDSTIRDRSIIMSPPVPPPPVSMSMAGLLLGGMTPAVLRGMLPVIEMQVRKKMEEISAPDYLREAVENLAIAARRYVAETDKKSTDFLDATALAEKNTQENIQKLSDSNRKE
jgi:hypothetical protein